MTLNTVVVPLRYHALAFWCHHEGIFPWDPLLLLGEVNQWQGLEQVTVLGLVSLGLGILHAALNPVGLVVVRACGHDDALIDTGHRPQIEYR